MKQIYKANDGTIFENKKDCLKHEFKIKGGAKQFTLEVLEAAKDFEKLTGLEVLVKQADASIGWDGDPNTDVQNYVEWQKVNLVISKDGKQIGENYSRGSQGGFTKKSIIEELTREFYAPYQKVHEGVLKESEHQSYYGEEYEVNGVNVNDILRANFGKKIRIEVFE
ncbi:hypothetical protein [Cytobacillus gottheilii]|uniref:hypothetical protein n=1 Tax=Cytobacillus gottheilii TaxID=859144 RepID=UPI0009BAFE44|nr:hypothetical protein [Cytobacillus gottheilii]